MNRDDNPATTKRKRPEGTSQYLGVYYSNPSNCWIVQLERYPHYPSFQDERDAGIFAEYYYRKLYGEMPNFPEMDDAELERELQKVLANRENEIGHNFSAGKQGKTKHKNKTSKYVGVFLKDKSRWCALINYRGKGIYILSISTKIAGAEEKAARAYDKMALQLYGENARLNFPVKE